MEHIFNICLYSLFWMLIVSSVPKIINMKYFLQLVSEYDFLPKPFLIIYGITLPFAEISGAILLMMTEYILIGSGLIFLLLVSFTIGVTYMIANGKETTCGCYGKLLDVKVGKLTLLKITFLLIANIVIVFGQNYFQVEFEIPLFLTGLALTFMILLFEKIWNNYKINVELLN
ncbi:MauE/DoxX family redox-associated membrane protein [Sutcliffiella sp. NPDC057660]|uniref:MauE/DoxX family redox-associated membrane protein n=1 Tax=Sutcliffiella sp. NPDC057660 TaxID=3346199 RepID=UPI0036B6ACA0